MNEKCSKCGGEGWVWWNELDEYDDSNAPVVDDTKYTCDRCDGKSVVNEYHVNENPYNWFGIHNR